ncbi:MAG: glycosyltransferase family 2 protein [Deltaproteobacteria bacterium]|uniref:Glycosyltransferase family 2 protein n=1 Tax=Candidatus Zymogenus saltonus TaxID=2844893 RepID=A0A9D8KDS6_9DELT|nr:glycosyltransferase family 2 protein [Candidatus Zymogenus saltonus]
MKGDKLPISVYIITKDNIRTLKKALLSVSDWADEIVAVDSGSSDGTLELLKEFTDRVYHRDWPGFREQYQHAQDLTKNRWAIFIDADEEVSPKLVEEIKDLFKNGEPEKDGYIAHRKTYFLGKWIKYGGWSRDYEIRLYKKDMGRWEGGLHAKVHLKGKVGEFKNYYLHYTYSDISDQIKTMDLYSRMAVMDMVEAKRKPSISKLILNPLFRFFRDYFFRLGFLGGIPGLVIDVTNAYYVFLKYAKLWEYWHVSRRDEEVKDK